MKKIHRYTLVELLVVVAIAAVILGIATPAFTAMMKGGAMTSTTRELAAKIKAARSYAVTNNCYVALVFPTGKDEAKIKTTFNFRTYRPCIVYKDSSDEWEFDSWIDGENWKTMNKGILIASPSGTGTDSEFFFQPASGSAKSVTSVKNVPVERLYNASAKDDDGPVTVKRAILFKPNGQLAGIENDEKLVFRITEGVAAAADKTQYTNIYTEGSQKKTIPTSFTINPLTCKIEFGNEPISISL